jgi:hypothetical protein
MTEIAIIQENSDVHVRGEPLAEIWWQGQQWAVTAYGVEARDGTYAIAKDRLKEHLEDPRPYSWIAHLGGKRWVDIDDFASAYFVAIAMHGQRLTQQEIALLRRHLRKCQTARHDAGDITP